jgi:hypothetical protein
MRKPVPLLLLAVLCVSCSPPPFDLALEQTTSTLKKLTRDNTALITVDTGGFNTGENNATFFPRVQLSGTDYTFDYSYGFVVSETSEPFGANVEVHAIQSGKQFSQQTFPIFNADPTIPSFQVWTAKSGLSLFGIGFDSQNPDNTSYTLFTSNLAAVPPTLGTVGNQLRSQVNMDLGLSGGIIGASIYPTAAGFDQLSLLVSDLGGNFGEAGYQVSATGLASAANLRSVLGPFHGLPFIPSALKRCQFFYDANLGLDPARSPNRSYVSWYDTTKGAWQAHTWWENPPGTRLDKPLPTVTSRIDALLSTGELFSTEGGTGRVYDREGAVLAQFPLGTLQFIGEELVGGVARSYFSLFLPYDEALHFNVYWIRTDQLKTLSS